MASESSSIKDTVTHLQEKDVSQVTEACAQLEAYLAENTLSADLLDGVLGAFSDSLLKHMNHKISLSAMKCLSLIVSQVGNGLKPYFNNLIDVLVDRLGDRQQAVRDFSLDIIIKLMDGLGPPTVFDRLRAAFKHKNPHVREHYMICFLGAISQYGPNCLSFGAFLPHASKFLTDTSPTVREAAIQCIETMYKFSGESLIDALRKQGLRPAILDPVLERLTQVEVVAEADRIPIEIEAPWVAGSGKKNNTLPRSKTPSARSSEHSKSADNKGVSSRPQSTTRLGRSNSGVASPGSVTPGRSRASKSTSQNHSRQGSRSGSRPRSPEREGGSTRSSSKNTRQSSSKKSSYAGSSTSNSASAASKGIPRSTSSLTLTGSSGANLAPDDRKDISPSGTIRSNQSGMVTPKPRSRRPSMFAGSSAPLELKLSDIKPVSVGTEKDLQTEMQEIATSLKDVNTVNWEKRIKALHRIAGLVLGGASDMDCFTELLYTKLREPLVVQATELRSTVCREACAVLCFLSRQLGDSFQNVADYVLPFLFKLTYVSIAVIAEAGHLCIRSILFNTPISKALTNIIQSCLEKNDALRLRCAQYLLIVLETTEANYLVKYSSDIEHLLRKLQGDRHEEVRSVSRQLFLAFRALWPDRGERMYSEWDESMKKKIVEERKTYVEDSAVRTADRKRDRELCIDLKQKRNGGSTLESTNGSITPRGRSKSVVAVGTGSISKLDFASISSTAAKSLGVEAISARTMVDAQPAVLSRHSRTLNSARAESSKPDEEPSQSSASASRSVSSTELKVPNASSRSGTLRSRSPGSKTPSGAKTPVSGSKTPRPTSVQANDDDEQRFEEKFAINFTRRASSNHGTLTSSIQPVPQQTSPQAASQPLASRPDRPASALSDEIEPRSRQSSITLSELSVSSPSALSPQQSPILLHPGARLAQVNFILVQGRSQNPATRLKTFEQLSELLRENIAIPDILITLDKLVTLFQDRIIDVNMKVSEKALYTLVDLLLCVKLKIIPYLEKLVPNIFLKLADSNPTIRHLANSILIKISQDFGGDTLYPVILRVLEIENPKVTTGCLEFLHHLISQPLRASLNHSAPQYYQISTFFKDPANVHELVMKVHPYIYNTTKIRLRDIAVSIFVQVIDHHNENALYAELLALPVQIAQLVLPPLEKFLPDLQHRLALFARTNPPLPPTTASFPMSQPSNSSNYMPSDPYTMQSNYGSQSPSFMLQLSAPELSRGQGVNTTRSHEALYSPRRYMESQPSFMSSSFANGSKDSSLQHLPTLDRKLSADSTNSLEVSLDGRHAHERTEDGMSADDDMRVKLQQEYERAHEREMELEREALMHHVASELPRPPALNTSSVPTSTRGSLTRPVVVSALVPVSPNALTPSTGGAGSISRSSYSNLSSASHISSASTPSVSGGNSAPGTFRDPSEHPAAHRPASNLPTTSEQKETPGNPDAGFDTDVEMLAQHLANAAEPLVRIEAIKTVVMLAQTNTDGTSRGPDETPTGDSKSLLLSHFDVLFLPLLDIFEDRNPNVMEAVLSAVIEVLACCPDPFSSPESIYSELLVIHLLEVFRLGSKNLYPAAETGLTLLSNLASPKQVYSTVVTTIEAERKGSSNEIINLLSASIKVLSRLVERLLDSAELPTALDRIVPALAGCLQSPSAVVRKEVVMFFVKAHKMLGDKLEPFIAALTSSQNRLIKTFISRQSASKQDDSVVAVS